MLLNGVAKSLPGPRFALIPMQMFPAMREKKMESQILYYDFL